MPPITGLLREQSMPMVGALFVGLGGSSGGLPPRVAIMATTNPKTRTNPPPTATGHRRPDLILPPGSGVAGPPHRPHRAAPGTSSLWQYAHWRDSPAGAGTPQCGHVTASNETARWHSRHVMKFVTGSSMSLVRWYAGSSGGQRALGLPARVCVLERDASVAGKCLAGRRRLIASPRWLARAAAAGW